MNRNAFEQFNQLDTEILASIEGGIVWWAIPAGVLAYGAIAGYTDEKCIMDNGKHWYCTKLD